MKREIVVCLDIKDGQVVKGVNFKDLKEMGTPVNMALQYEKEGADKLVLLNIASTSDNQKGFISLVKKIVDSVNISVIVGGGIKSLKDAQNLLETGASQICVGSAAVINPDLIRELSEEFGRKKIICAVDYQSTANGKKVYINGGKKETILELTAWVETVESLGAGGILLTSMDHDGMKQGFDLTTLQEISEKVKIPVIASGGAGSVNDFIELFSQTNIQYGLGAGIFHYGEVELTTLKQELSK